ncbi:MAG: hypothetical protein CMJ44_13310 [Pimelobacter sp.]|nr:hypothetical protein [Pimelobacter sp.]
MPIYTGERWAVFTDLGAWHEDVAEYTDCRDMTEVAGVALYLVAERLTVSIFAELNEASEDEKHVHGWDYAVGAHVCQQRGILADFCDVYDDDEEV